MSEDKLWERRYDWLVDHKPVREKTARNRAFRSAQIAFQEGENRLRERIANGSH